MTNFYFYCNILLTILNAFSNYYQKSLLKRDLIMSLPLQKYFTTPYCIQNKVHTLKFSNGSHHNPDLANS